MVFSSRIRSEPVSASVGVALVRVMFPGRELLLDGVFAAIPPSLLAPVLVAYGNLWT